MAITTDDKSGRKFFGMMYAAKKYIALILFASCATALHAQTIQFKIINGRTGRPMANVCVSAVEAMWNNASTPIFLRTDRNGVAHLRLTYEDSEVDIPYNLKLYCGPTGAVNPVLKYKDTMKPYTTGYYPSCAFSESMPNARWKEVDSISTKEVLKHGFVSTNMCGNITASPQPGEVILFVRPRNFHEKVHDWQNSDAFPF